MADATPPSGIRLDVPLNLHEDSNQPESWKKWIEDTLRLGRTIRLLTLAGLFVLLVGSAAYAQRGPGGGGGAPGGGGPGGPGGGGPGGPGGGGPGGGMGQPGGGMNQPGGGFGPPGAGGMGNPGNRGQGVPAASQPHVGPQFALPGRWWDDKRTIKSLQLTNDQQHRMDGIFESNRSTLFNLYSNLQREESRLSSMSGKDLQDQAKVFAAIDRVAQARAELEKETAHIVLQLRKEMDPGQLQALDRQLSKAR